MSPEGVKRMVGERQSEVKPHDAVGEEGEGEDCVGEVVGCVVRLLLREAVER
jgi:hypothetical protein